MARQLYDPKVLGRLLGQAPHVRGLLPSDVGSDIVQELTDPNEDEIVSAFEGVWQTASRFPAGGVLGWLHVSVISQVFDIVYDRDSGLLGCEVSSLTMSPDSTSQDSFQLSPKYSASGMRGMGGHGRCSFLVSSPDCELTIARIAGRQSLRVTIAMRRSELETVAYVIDRLGPS